MKTRAQRALEITQKWAKVDPRLVSECSPKHIQSVLEDAKADIRAMADAAETIAALAQGIFSDAKCSALFWANRGHFSDAGTLQALLSMSLIERYEYVSTCNEIVGALNRYWRRRGAGLPVLGH